MILSRAHRAGTNAARTCALAIALALALGGSRPAAAGRGGTARISAGLGGLTVRKPDSAWRAATTGLQPKSERGFADRMRIRLAQRRRAPLTFPGLEHGAVTDEPNPWASYRRVAGTPSGRRPSAVATRRAEPPGSKRLHPVGPGPAASRFSGGHGLGAAAAWLAGQGRTLLGDRRVRDRALLQPAKPSHPHPLGYGQLRATGERLALLSQRARVLLGGAAAGMNRSPQRPHGAGSLAALNPRMQDEYVRRHYELACAGGCGDMKPLGEKLRGLPGWEAWVAREHQSGHGTTRHGVQQRIVPTMPTPVLAAGGLQDFARPLIVMN
jgi:hypothetical protein